MIQNYKDSPWNTQNCLQKHLIKITTGDILIVTPPKVCTPQIFWPILGDFDQKICTPQDFLGFEIWEKFCTPQKKSVPPKIFGRLRRPRNFWYKNAIFKGKNHLFLPPEAKIFGTPQKKNWYPPTSGLRILAIFLYPPTFEISNLKNPYYPP